MRFSALFVLAGVAVLVGHREPGVATATVTAGARCNAGNDSTWVNPFQVSITVGDSVAWVVDPAGDADSIVIRPKQGNRWPFTGQPPRGRGKGRPFRSGRSDTTGTYHYDIVLYCPQGNEGHRPVVIDPDIIIGGRP